MSGCPELPDSTDPRVWLHVLDRAQAALEEAHLARWEAELDGLPAQLVRLLDVALGRPAPPRYFDLGGGQVVELNPEEDR